MLAEHQLVSPSAEYRPIPIWFWNGDLEEEELCRQVRAMAEGGLGGFQIAARTGLTTPYLSDHWFGLVEAVTREAQRHGLQVWLADEYPYPSGASGGELTLRHPEYRAWQMNARSCTAEPGQSVECFSPGSVLLQATAVPIVNGVTDWARAIDLHNEVGISQPEPVFVEPAFGYSGKRTFSFGPQPKLSWSAPRSSAWEIWLVAAAELAPYKFYGHYVDLCNPEAVRAFLATTYQRYIECLDPTSLRQISGFFLDEAHPQSWSWELPAAFQKQVGYDLVPVLPALWTNIGPKTAQVRYDYWQTITTGISGRLGPLAQRPFSTDGAVRAADPLGSQQSRGGRATAPAAWAKHPGNSDNDAPANGWFGRCRLSPGRLRSHLQPDGLAQRR